MPSPALSIFTGRRAASRWLHALAGLLLAWDAAAYTTDPGCTANTSYMNKVRLNEVKSQGGGSGFAFVEIYTLDNNVNLSGYKIGVSGYSGNPKSPWTKEASGAIATLALGTGKGCVDHTGSSMSCTNSNDSQTLNYGRYVLYELPNMDQHDGQIVLLDNNGKIVDFLAYSDQSSCDTGHYWTPPASGSTCYNVSNCASGIGASNADISRSTDGTGEWMKRGSDTTQGASNAGSSAPPGGAGYKFVFNPTCSGNNLAVQIQAVWINANGSIVSPQQTYSGATGTLTVSINASNVTVDSTQPTLTNGIAGVVLSGSGLTPGSTIGISAVNPQIPGTATTGTLTAPACTGVDHYEIELPVSGITCEPSTISIRACVDAAFPCTTLSTSPSSITLTSSEGSFVSAGAATQTFAGTTTFQLSVAKPGSATIGLSGSPAARYQCRTPGASTSRACTTDFSGSLLKLEAAADYACRERNLKVTAIKANGQQCVPGLIGDHSLKFRSTYGDPTSGTRVPSIAGVAIDAEKTLVLSFSASGEATPSFRYDDAGSLTLTATHASASSMTGSTSIVTAPERLAFINTPPDPWKAGSPGTLTIEGRCNDNTTTTPNLGKESSAQLSFSTELTETTLSNGEIRINGNLLTAPGEWPATTSPLSGTRSSAVKATGTTPSLEWTEVGRLTARATITNYLNSGLSIPTPVEQTIRFAPAYVDLTVTPPCTGFLYAGQPFGLTLTARNARDGITENYDRATPNSTTPNAFAVDLTANQTSQGSLNPNPATVSASTFQRGVATVLNTAAAAPAWNYTAASPSATDWLPLQVQFHAENQDSPKVSSTGHESAALREVRRGQLRISSNFGNGRLPLRLPVQAQYWNGTHWVLNTLDNCTTLPASAFHLVSPPAGTAVSGPVALTAGRGELTLSAPTSAQMAVIDLAAALGQTGVDNACLSTHGGSAAAMPWLRSRNGSCASTYDRDPSARATFGVYAPETRRNIHVREWYAY